MIDLSTFMLIMTGLLIWLIWGRPYLKNLRKPKKCNCSPDCNIPYGRCHCGCGQLTKIKGFYNEYGMYIEVGPAKYAPGHDPNLSPSQSRDVLGITRPKIPQRIIGKKRIRDGLYI